MPDFFSSNLGGGGSGASGGPFVPVAGGSMTGPLLVGSTLLANNLSGNNFGEMTLATGAVQGGASITPGSSGVPPTLNLVNVTNNQNGYFLSTDYANLFGGVSSAVSQFLTARNNTAATLTPGTAVAINGYDNSSNNPTVILATAASVIPAVGLVAQAIGPSLLGLLQVQGTLSNINTSGLTQGLLAYVGVSPGLLQPTQPQSPSTAQSAGIVIKSDATTGQIFTVFQQMDQIQSGSRNRSFSVGDGFTGTIQYIANGGAPYIQNFTPSLGTTISVTWPNSAGNVVIDAATQFLSNKRFPAASTWFQRTGDSSCIVFFDMSAGSTATSLALRPTQSVSITIAFPSASTVIGGLAVAQSWLNTNNFLDGSTTGTLYIRSATDSTKRLLFNTSSNTTGTDTVFATSSSSSLTITFFNGTDTVVGTSLVQTVAQKRKVPRANSVAASANSFTPNFDTTDVATVSGFSNALVSIVNPTYATALNGEMRMIIFQGLGNSTGVTFGTGYVGTSSLALPNYISGSSLIDRVLFQEDTIKTKFAIVGYVQGQ